MYKRQKKPRPELPLGCPGTGCSSLLPGGGGNTLATPYSHMACRHTTIGAGAFHFRVRDGTGWGRPATATRGRAALGDLAVGDTSDRAARCPGGSCDAGWGHWSAVICHMAAAVTPPGCFCQVRWPLVQGLPDSCRLGRLVCLYHDGCCGGHVFCMSSARRCFDDPVMGVKPDG